LVDHAFTVECGHLKTNLAQHWTESEIQEALKQHQLRNMLLSII